jgi:hypothetical protein
MAVTADPAELPAEDSADPAPLPDDSVSPARPSGQHGKLTERERHEIQRLALTGKYTQSRIAQLVKCSRQAVCGVLVDQRELAHSIIQASLKDAAHAVKKSYAKRPSIAADMLDRFGAIPPQQVSANQPAVQVLIQGIDMQGLTVATRQTLPAKTTDQTD